MSLFKWISTFLRDSSHVHVREEINSVSDAIELIDRFIDGSLRYPLEWDDFISWENATQGVGRLREEIGQLEPMFFSSDKNVRMAAHRRLLEIRNRFATFNSIAIRSDPYS